ncbi:hypothetical protein MMC06_001970 [Schaereria dolodes]|nr:hypothetical protein [Schaereria dolodes]
MRIHSLAQDTQREGNEQISLGDPRRRFRSSDSPRMVSLHSYGNRPPTPLYCLASKESASQRRPSRIKSTCDPEIRSDCRKRVQTLKSTQIRTKYISLRSRQISKNYHQSFTNRCIDSGMPNRLDEFSSAWSTTFARIVAKYDRQLHPQGRKASIKMRLHERLDVKRWFKKLGSDWTNTESILKAWEGYSSSESTLLWQHVLLWTLKMHPTMAIRILDATILHPLFRLPNYAVVDSIDYIACAFLQRSNSWDTTIAKQINSLVQKFLKVCDDRGSTVSITQRTLLLLSQHRDADELVSLYKYFRAQRAKIHVNTTLHFITRFCELGKLDSAVEAFQHLAEGAADLDSASVQSVCVRMLRTEFEIENLYDVRCNVLTQILGLGLRPNRQLYNVIVLNAMEAGDCRTGWHIYEIAKENGLMPDAYTYAILLKAVKYSGDHTDIETVYRSAMQDGTLSQSPRLATELLHAIYIVERNERNQGLSTAYESLLPTYMRFFSLQPLLDLGIPIRNSIEKSSQSFELKEPHQAAIGIMILSYLEQHHAKVNVFELYGQYVRLITQGHPILGPLAESTHTANAFLMALSQQSHSLHLCARIIEDMLRQSASWDTSHGSSMAGSDITNANGYVAAKPKAYRVAGPNVQSWSILVLGFIRHGQAAAAEKVISIMSARGMFPNVVTWNTLAAGYSKMQDFKGAVDAIYRLEKAGLVADDYTRKALSRVFDRTKLMEAFEVATREHQQLAES